MSCIICNTSKKENLPYCDNCGFFFRDAKSEYYQELENRKIQIRKSLFVQNKEKIEELDYEIKKIDKMKNSIEEVEKQIKDLRRNINIKKKYYEQQVNEFEQKEEAIIMLKNFERYFEHRNILFKKYYHDSQDTRRICYKTRGRKVKIECINYDKKPSLLLVLGKLEMGIDLEKAQYFIKLDDYLEEKGKGLWECSIPNAFNLKGKFLGFLTTLHKEKENQIGILETKKITLTF